MKSFISAAVLVAALIAAPGVANAGGDQVSDRANAIQLCRAEVAAQSGVDPASLRLDNARVRVATVRVDLDVWRDGQLQNVRCDVARNHGELTIASITPALQTVATAR